MIVLSIVVFPQTIVVAFKCGMLYACHNFYELYEVAIGPQEVGRWVRASSGAECEGVSIAYNSIHFLGLPHQYLKL